MNPSFPRRHARRRFRNLAVGITGALALAMPATALAGGTDAFPGTTLPGALPVSDTGSNVGATKQANEPATIGENDSAGGASVWWSWTAPTTGTVTVDTCDSDFDTLLGVYTGNALPVTLLGDNDDATCGGVGALQSEVEFTATAGTTYRILVDGYSTSTGPADTGSISLSITAGGAADPPPNDDLVDALEIPNDPIDDMISPVVDNTLATKEASENNHAGNAGGHSVWFHWTAPQTGDYAAFTCGLPLDSLLAVYTDPDPAGPFPLTEVGSSDDDPDICGTGAEDDGVVFFAANAGDVFKLAVDGKDGETADVVAAGIEFLSDDPPPPTPPANDMFADAQLLTGATATAGGSNVGATAESGEPDHSPIENPGFLPQSSIWYSWTAPGTGETTISLCGSPVEFNSALAVYTGSVVEALDGVAFSDDGCGSPFGLSRVTFQATANTTYRIAVDGFGSISDQIVIDVAGPPGSQPVPVPESTGTSADEAACASAQDALAEAKAKLKKAKKRLKKAKASGDEDKIAKAKKAVKKAKKRVRAAQAAVEAACGTAPKVQAKAVLAPPALDG